MVVAVAGVVVAATTVVPALAVETAEIVAVAVLTIVVTGTVAVVVAVVVLVMALVAVEVVAVLEIVVTAKAVVTAVAVDAATPAALAAAAAVPAAAAARAAVVVATTGVVAAATTPVGATAVAVASTASVTHPRPNSAQHQVCFSLGQFSSQSLNPELQLYGSVASEQPRKACLQHHRCFSRSHSFLHCSKPCSQSCSLQPRPLCSQHQRFFLSAQPDRQLDRPAAQSSWQSSRLLALAACGGTAAWGALQRTSRRRQAEQTRHSLSTRLWAKRQACARPLKVFAAAHLMRLLQDAVWPLSSHFASQLSDLSASASSG
mmetsp:Transcript_122792/g.342136  ORF Transcript_122792/g.342136 Transcript_122792/m.342136 type:complete len:318 (+) Transcript_122792:312-1265(+)